VPSISSTARCTLATKAGSRSSRTETFTPTEIGPPAALRMATESRATLASTDWPSWTTRPESSARPTKTSVGTSVPSSCHRDSASTPVTRPVAHETTGW